MPVKVVKRGNKHRLIEPSGRIAKNKANKSVDGGGHSSAAKAASQARAINASLKRK